jgi:hypothetical protein
MKDEINIPVLKVEDVISAAERRKRYSLKRDLQALEFNSAIVSRLLAEKANIIKCAKCGKEFSSATTTQPALNCPNCK